MVDGTQRPANLVICATGSSHVALLPAHLRVIQSTLPVNIRVVMTPAATSILSRSTLESIGFNVWTDDDRIFDDGRPTHVALTRWADILLVLPASANSIGKMAHGICDGLSGLLFMGAHTAERAVAPAMNECLWTSPGLQRNLDSLRRDGVGVIAPQAGQPFTTGDVGVGLSPTPRRIVDYLISATQTASRSATDNAVGSRTARAPLNREPVATRSRADVIATGE